MLDKSNANGASAVEDESEQDKKTAGRTRAYAVAGKIVAGVGFTAAVVQLIDYAVSAPRTVWLAVGLLLVVLPLLAVGTHLIRHRDLTALVVLIGIVGSTWLGLFLILGTASGDTDSRETDSGTSLGDSDSTEKESVRSFDGVDSCREKTDAKGDPPRRRDCVSLLVSTNSLDLDSLDPSWGTPNVSEETGADLKKSAFDADLEATGDARLTFLEAATAEYSTCRRNTVWAGSLDVDERAADAVDVPAICIRTEQGRFGLLFLDEVTFGAPASATSPVKVTALVWDRNDPKSGS
ncbi:MAG: hypothetical protein ACRCYU_02945 [Nocardioides sp.]